VVGACGGFEKAFLEKRLKKLLDCLPGPSVGRKEVDGPQIAKGKSLLFLDKAGRNQCQVLIGAPGIHFAHKDYFALLLANHVFGGGSFSARLMSEVREKRGWSYGAYSFYRSGRKPLYFAMQTVPANKDTVPALQLMIKLFQHFAKKGLTKEEFVFAKKSLLSQSAFLQDTYRKKLDNKVTEAVLGLPANFYDKYRAKIKALTYAKVQRAIKKTVDPSRVFVLVLGTLPELKRDLNSLRGFKNIWQVSYDKAPVEPKSLERIIF
jgi:zinc protease